MASDQDIVIVGAGIAGLATSLGLHRLGIQSLVLESADSLRTTGFAFVMWTNAWRAIDALGLGEILRSKHNQLTGIVTTSVDSGITTAELPFSAIDSQGDHDIRCMNRRLLLETLESELPKGTVRYSSKVVHIEKAGYFNFVHLADGTTLKTKPALAGRSAVRAVVHYEDGHGFEPKLMQFFGNGIRYGIIPCDDQTLYWFFTFSPSADPVSDKIKEVVENTQFNNMVLSQLRFRYPWELLWRNISQDNICVAGDALHPMTPDLGQGGCAALEDSIVLARVLAEALKEKSSEENEHRRICEGVEKFAKERRWRGFELISTAYIVGFLQQSNGIVLNFFRDKLAKFLGGLLLKKASFDCGKLNVK
ncbi:hypothetical protein ACJIZ3_015270 [Penstemon smallii]|uniref:FAD-binding domain-containing protein n=1 Tax=Penstemon smallii TaxID=265156 RepID=A0ABD3RM01_9LAMI